jgi:CheY-like chemotaxis protein
MRILIVDDEARMAESIKDYFQPEGLESDLASNGGQARRLLEEKPYDALVSDLRMPGMDGMQLLRWVKDEGPEIPVIMISAHGDIRDAVEAMREGAYDYLVKPFDPDELLLKVRKAVENRRLRLSVLAGMAGKTKDEMIGESPAMREVDKILAKASPSGLRFSSPAKAARKGSGGKAFPSLFPARRALRSDKYGSLPRAAPGKRTFRIRKRRFYRRGQPQTRLIRKRPGGHAFSR